MSKKANESNLNSFCNEKELFENIKRYIDENYKDKLLLADIAKTFFVSVSTSCCCFKSNCGMSIKKYIIMKRITEAKKLIDSGMSAQEVCESLGYERYTTFYRNYKDYFGVSPSHKTTGEK